TGNGLTTWIGGPSIPLIVPLFGGTVAPAGAASAPATTIDANAPTTARDPARAELQPWRYTLERPLFRDRSAPASCAAGAAAARVQRTAAGRALAQAGVLREKDPRGTRLARYRRCGRRAVTAPPRARRSRPRSRSARLRRARASARAAPGSCC